MMWKFSCNFDEKKISNKFFQEVFSDFENWTCLKCPKMKIRKKFLQFFVFFHPLPYTSKFLKTLRKNVTEKKSGKKCEKCQKWTAQYFFPTKKYILGFLDWYHITQIKLLQYIYYKTLNRFMVSTQYFFHENSRKSTKQQLSLNMLRRQSNQKKTLTNDFSQ